MKLMGYIVRAGRSLAMALALYAATASAALAARAPYRTDGDCGGLPRIPLQVAAGFCVGLAAQGLGMPRGVLPLADGDLLVTDLGSWDRGHGRLLRLHPKNGGFETQVLARGLNRPHGLQLDAKGQAWIGEDDRISRFDPTAADPHLVPVIDGLPSDGRHPLKTFVIAGDGSIIVDIGSSSDNCDGSHTKSTCAEAEGDSPRGALWRFIPEGSQWRKQVYATGLRNSVALAIDPRDSTLWQGENGRDAINVARGSDAPDEDTPHDALNHVHAGGRYGWPYCYDAGLASPEFPAADCSRYDHPAALLPAHSAPLGMVFYRNDKLPPPWNDVLVIGLHGYRRNGHRIVAIPWGPHPDPAAALLPLIAGWDGAAGIAPMGTPVDIKADAKGDLWVTEDRNGTLLRIHPLP